METQNKVGVTSERESEEQSALTGVEQIRLNTFMIRKQKHDFEMCMTICE